MQRVKYPMTAEAKQAARYLVESWNSARVRQKFSVYRNSATLSKTTSSSAPFQSVGLSHGNVSQQITSSELADRLLVIIASDVLQSNPDLSAAIQELRTSLESERQSKLGKVISQLGRSLEHANNARVLLRQ